MNYPKFSEIPKNGDCPWPLKTELRLGEIVPWNFYPEPGFLPAQSNLFLWGAFDHMETEVSAGWILRFLHTRDKAWQKGWGAFTHTEIQSYYSMGRQETQYRQWLKDQKGADPRTCPHRERFTFNRLIEPGRAYSIRTGHCPKGGGWVKCLDPDQSENQRKYVVTIDFVQRVVASIWSQGLFDPLDLTVLQRYLHPLPATTGTAPTPQGSQ